MTIDRSHRRVVLGMPGYGKQTAAAGRGFWRACRNPEEIYHYYQQGSLLASNFNQLWCLALNLSHRGERVDYFAMLHDDIGPEDFWLDKLIDELEEQRLDVLGVSVPIKDSRGITSMALHRDGDDWMPLARLSMHDVFELPETFTSDDIGAPLLLNSGCWVAKWNQDWCRTVHFQVNDRVVFNRSQNCYQAQTEPEDWNFSRQLHEIGTGPTDGLPRLRIGATRKVRVVHTGDTEFVNDKPWGRNVFDHESCKISPVPNAFPRDIPGWLHPAEGKELARLAQGNRVLEIGSYCGLSTVCMARTAEHVTAVDYFDGRATPCQRDTLKEFHRNLVRYGVAGKVTTCHPDAEIPLPKYDLAFIDGAHDYESVRADIDKCFSVLKPDGLLAFHDYRKTPGEFDGSWDPGVTTAVNELVATGAEIISRHDTLAVVRPPACISLEV